MKHLLTAALIFLGLYSTASADYFDRGHERRPPPYGSPSQVIRIMCASNDYRATACPVGGFIQDVRLVRQYSHSPCNMGSDVTYDRSYLYVTNGCQGEFDVFVYNDNGGYPQPLPPPPPPRPRVQDVHCTSSGYRYNSCGVDGYVDYVELIRQDSHSACRRGESFGALSDRIWVDRGCEGTFRVYLRY